ncbi:hypothetical protein ABTX61_30365 [Amycolatopsis japonica]|uniref:hypothetical protein n=1 Tax=Amycolatopsis japonica TaxID=208439 RepID=UPI00332574C0
MRTIRRTLVASALALPLTLGAAGIASADTYGSTEVQAGPDGAATHSTSATAGENGDSQYRQHSGWAGQDGAGSSETHSSTDGGHDQGVLSGTLGAIGL